MYKLSSVSSLIYYKLNSYFRNHCINRKNRKTLSNWDFSLLASNCTGALILHDLNLRFQSPFVNLMITPHDFIKYLKNIDHYINSSMTFVKVGDKSYPVGLLDDITINFIHYKTEKDALEKWNERTSRIDKNKIFVIMTEKDGCTAEDLIAFDSLPYKNKVVFTHIPYPQIKCAYYIKGFEEEKECGILSDYKKKQVLGKRYYDDFDYVKWFNNGYFQK